MEKISKGAPVVLSLLSLLFSLQAALGAVAVNSESPDIKSYKVPEGKHVQLNAHISIIDMQAVANVLASHKIVLLIDQSLSMGARDCPDHTTRWQWCERQSSDLAHTLAPLTGDDLTVVTFNSTHQVYKNCSTSKVHDIFNNEKPYGITDLVDPLLEQINIFVGKPPSSRRPLLVAVITDGRPQNESIVRNIIIKASNRLADPNQLCLVFLQIGDAFYGRDYLHDLDRHLVGHGAKYDIVSLCTFDQLIRDGLARSLANAILTAERNDRSRMLSQADEHFD